MLAAFALVAALLVLASVLRQRRRSGKPGAPASPRLADAAKEVWQMLRERQPRNIQVAAELHQLPPFIPKATWSQLGDLLRVWESPTTTFVPGDRYLTLRLDGSGFSKLTKRLTAAGAFSDGYSTEFAELMRECCQSLMVKFSAMCGYTQSDEMTLVLAPASVVRGEQQCHSHGGRVVKICTLAASHVTALFNFRLQALFASKGLSIDESLLASFDCRIGSFASFEEAMALVLWRAADCGVNGVSDAVYKSKIPGAKKVVGLGTDEKLRWLAENQLLPLQPHQAYGSFFAKVRRLHEGVNPKTGQTAVSLRSTIEEVPGHVLCLAKEGQLFPKDDTEAPGS
ncbi:unnamed protein product [Effrenium voratum]|uniref:tRNAHis guanylyltransferase catalytic domain-containing protein n=1 Tax=Effrenium voratum TaxID=2562239 RepID=A0AA36MM12_9DINO|nr:unnamed protein product [Effrenium voratum]CAJ1428573.1 unnamed protein product [Effrenium voratum]